mmetsp:Transcript_24930/g.58068  ORF Transcript_24930/g.58068 Transcript_24930/m.58068 type:complete len:555 (+) Transcript_24930:3-1667(+)
MAAREKRRQAAGMVVQSFFTMGKKSTAQPRPKLHVPPRGIGPIAEPNENDVLCGRGGRINAHEGNVQFREIVNTHKKEYLAKSTKKLEKAHIAARIVEQVRSMDPPGRFLKEDSDTGMWFDVGDAKAIKKAGQALREDAPDIRQGLGDGGGGSSGDEAPKAKPAKKTKQPATPKPVATVSLTQTTPTDPVVSSVAGPGRGFKNRATAGRGKSSVTMTATKATTTTTTAATAVSWVTPAAGGSGYVVPVTAGSNIASSFPAYSNQQPFGGPAPQPQHGSANSVASGGLRSMQGARSVATRASALSKRALEAIHPVHPALNGMHIPPEQVAFGRAFTPTEISGGTMSTISGFSGVSGFSAAHSALSLGSSGFGLASLRPGHLGDRVIRPRGTQVSEATHIGGERIRPRGNQVSEMTFNFMSNSGLARSPSFGELSMADAPMSDASLIELMGDDKTSEIGSITSYGIRHPSSTASGKPHQISSAESAMSVASGGSFMSASVKSVGSDNSWLKSMKSKNTASVNSGENPWGDDRSFMSDVSENLVALDLAAASLARGV